jgi:retron-type reverse transcriptase
MQRGEYLKEHNILSPYQCGFRKAHSTEFAAISCGYHTEKYRTRIIDRGTDFRKAFDSIDHSVLLNTLSALGIVDHELVWFEDYLHNRNQIAGYQGVYSEAEYLTSGVPQSSILGPLLFVLYVNDLPSVVRNCKILMYADDTSSILP